MIEFNLFSFSLGGLHVHWNKDKKKIETSEQLPTSKTRQVPGHEVFGVGSDRRPGPRAHHMNNLLDGREAVVLVSTGPLRFIEEEEDSIWVEAIDPTTKIWREEYKGQLPDEHPEDDGYYRAVLMKGTSPTLDKFMDDLEKKRKNRLPPFSKY
jgi:hypothetical protein